MFKIFSTAVIFAVLLAAATAANKSVNFDGVDQWKASLLAENAGGLRELYSADPPAQYISKDNKLSGDIAPETDFWQQIMTSGVRNLAVSTVDEQDQQGLHVVKLLISMILPTPTGPRTRYVLETQHWQTQGGQWRIVAASHSDVYKLRPALKKNPNLYDTQADARAEIKESVAKAGKEHKRVILVFGANWCYDCQVLDQAFHQPDVAPLLAKHFLVAHIDIGDDGKKNHDLAQEYGIPLEKGIPALAILDSSGKLLYSQQSGEWESARSLDPDDIITFLNKWKS